MVSHTLPYMDDGAQLVRALVKQSKDAVWLDSAGGFGRYSLIAAAPRLVLTSRDGVVEYRRDGIVTGVAVEDPLAAVRRELGPRRATTQPPFEGGAIGYFGYDLGERLAGVRGGSSDTGAVPEMVVGLYDWVVVTDHRDRRSWLAGPTASTELREALRRAADEEAAAGQFGCRIDGSDLERDAYASAFARVRRYLRDGDCYQVNLARTFTAIFEGDALSAYLQLRRRSPGPHCAYLDFADLQVLSVSPERLLQLRDGRVETRPIKGTRARRDPRDDAVQLAELRGSVKDRAENLMIVDLLRNDLGRVCRTGSIRVPELFATESYATVHHLVSTVTGVMPPDTHATDLLRAALPGGSITGAPKHRAMEIIAELEPSRRGVYCGAIGYIGHDGAMDTSVAIRTAVRRGSRLEYRAGGGLVWDSRCAAEFDETTAKARAFLDLQRHP